MSGFRRSVHAANDGEVVSGDTGHGHDFGIDDDGEIKKCFDCQDWDDADDFKGEGWD